MAEIRDRLMQFMQLGDGYIFHHPDFMPFEELFTQAKNWITENDAAWQFCQDPVLMVE